MQLFSSLQHLPLNISKECMNHLYPDETTSKLEFGYDRLKIGEITDPFMMLTFLLLFALFAFFVEITFDRIQRDRKRRQKKSVSDVVRPGKLYEFHFILRDDYGTAHNVLHEKLKILLRDFNVGDIHRKQVKAVDGENAFQY
jgi:hypothetical protein